MGSDVHPGDYTKHNNQHHKNTTKSTTQQIK